MPQYQQVSGGACSLTMYMESAPGKVAPGSKGTRFALYSEGFARGSAKKQRTVIGGKRGPGKPYLGLPKYDGKLVSAAYAPQVGHILRHLCGPAVTQAEPSRPLDAAPVVEIEMGVVGIPCAGHGFVQDAVITIVGTQNYDGSYRVAPGVTPDVLAIAAPFVAETLPADAGAYRGRAAFLSGPAADLGMGMVALPVKGNVHALNAGEKTVISGTQNYDGEHVLQQGSENGLLVITASFNEEEFDGLSFAAPVFYRHNFALPRRQPTVTVEKYLDFEDGAAVNKYRRFGFCKVNGLSFNFGGDDELKFDVDYTVGRESMGVEPLDASPVELPAVTMDNIEISLFVAGVRRGDVETGSFNNTFGVEAKAAVGDLGQYSRMPEGDPECKATMSVFLEQEDMQALADARSTVPFALAVCSATGDELWFRYPEAELDTEGPAINGKAGLMQEMSVLAFVDRGQSVFTAELINRVAAYA